MYVYVYLTWIFTFREPTSCWSPDLDVAPFVQHVGPAVTFSASPVEIFRLFFTTTLSSGRHQSLCQGGVRRLCRGKVGWCSGRGYMGFFGGLLCLWGSTTSHNYIFTGASIPLPPHSRAHYQGPLGFCRFAGMTRKCVICDMRIIILYIIVFSIWSSTSYWPTLEGLASSISRFGCLPCKLPGAGYGWSNGGLQRKVIYEAVLPEEASKHGFVLGTCWQPQWVRVSLSTTLVTRVEPLK